MYIPGIDEAYEIAAATAAEPKRARRWSGQNGWDKDHMVTESARFTVREDAALRNELRRAHLNKYQLIGYMLRIWMQYRKLNRERERQKDDQ